MAVLNMQKKNPKFCKIILYFHTRGGKLKAMSWCLLPILIYQPWSWVQTLVWGQYGRIVLKSKQIFLLPNHSVIIAILSLNNCSCLWKHSLFSYLGGFFWGIILISWSFGGFISKNSCVFLARLIFPERVKKMKTVTFDMFLKCLIK